MFSNKTNEYRSSFDVQSQCENLVADDSMWRISHVNQSYRVIFYKLSTSGTCILSYIFCISIKMHN